MAEIIELHNKPPRMRGVKQAVEELRAADSDTALTEHALRRLILSGELPSVRCGTKYLINMDVLINYLYNGSCGVGNAPVNDYGNIRKVSE